MKAIGIIPARLESRRFEEKVLADICGKPMIQYVYEAAKKSTMLSESVIATDSPKIERACKDFGATVIMTTSDHKSGTSRVAEVAKHMCLLPNDIVVNIQGDEPLIASYTIDMLADTMFKRKEEKMATMAFRTRKNRLDFNTVKVVIDSEGYAMYFSRALIPTGALVFWHHVGIYAYRFNFLLEYMNLPESNLEKEERLEQLKAMEYGHKIFVVDCKQETFGVDTLEDLVVVRKIMEKNIISPPKCNPYTVHP